MRQKAHIHKNNYICARLNNIEEQNLFESSCFPTSATKYNTQKLLHLNEWRQTKKKQFTNLLIKCDTAIRAEKNLGI